MRLVGLHIQLCGAKIEGTEQLFRAEKNCFLPVSLSSGSVRVCRERACLSSSVTKLPLSPSSTSSDGSESLSLERLNLAAILTSGERKELRQNSTQNAGEREWGQILR